MILDRFPAAQGHILIITKAHYSDLLELGEKEAKELMPLAKKMAELVVKVTGAEGFNIIQNNKAVAGQSVYHFHLHIVPRKTNDQIILNKSSNTDTTIEDLEAVYQAFMKEIN